MTDRPAPSGATLRRFRHDEPFGADMRAVRDLLLRVNSPEVTVPGFLWARWDWAFTLPFFDHAHRDRIGIWEDAGRVVGVAAYEEGLGEAWLIVEPEHRDLLSAMADHALAHLAGPRGLRVMVADGDRALEEVLAARGLTPTGGREENQVLDLTRLADTPPATGFSTASLAAPWDLERLHRLLHRGFDHPGEPDLSPVELAWRLDSTRGPSQLPELQVIATAADGTYAAFCGVWRRPGTSYALVEPVCTDPAYRRRGAGRAAVLEALRRAREQGATEAWVGSDQEFYRRLGFAPGPGGAWWATAP